MILYRKYVFLLLLETITSVVFRKQLKIPELQGSHYFQIRGRNDFSFRELTGRSGEISGRSQLRLIETLFHGPSDVTLPKFSKQLKLPALICSGFFLFIHIFNVTFLFLSTLIGGVLHTSDFYMYPPPFFLLKYYCVVIQYHTNCNNSYLCYINPCFW